MNNDVQVEKLLIELKEYISEKERLIGITHAMISEYEDKKNQLKNDIIEKENQIKNIIISLIDENKMKETKTQKSYKLLSGKIIKTKDKEDIRLREVYNIDDIPKEYIITKKTIDWINYKKQLMISGEDIVDKNTGEVLEYATILRTKGEYKIKINKEKD